MWGLGDIRDLETPINSVLSPEIMSIVSKVNQATKLQSANTQQIEKAGWALRQRLRKPMNQLSSSFFDEVDDFVFEAGNKGQFTSGGDYLSVMREIRAK